jgi:hypothetical protein
MIQNFVSNTIWLSSFDLNIWMKLYYTVCNITLKKENVNKMGGTVSP